MPTIEWKGIHWNNDQIKTLVKNFVNTRGPSLESIERYILKFLHQTQGHKEYRQKKSDHWKKTLIILYQLKMNLIQHHLQ